MEGEDYTLTCAVMDGSVAVTLPNAVFRWDKVNDTVDLSGGATLSFNPVLRADEGVYRCTATANNTEPFSVVGTSSLSVTRKSRIVYLLACYMQLMHEEVMILSVKMHAFMGIRALVMNAFSSRYQSI